MGTHSNKPISLQKLLVVQLIPLVLVVGLVCLAVFFYKKQHINKILDSLSSDEIQPLEKEVLLLGEQVEKYSLVSFQDHFNRFSETLHLCSSRLDVLEASHENTVDQQPIRLELEIEMFKVPFLLELVSQTSGLDLNRIEVEALEGKCSARVRVEGQFIEVYEAQLPEPMKTDYSDEVVPWLELALKKHFYREYFSQLNELEIKKRNFELQKFFAPALVKIKGGGEIVWVPNGEVQLSDATKPSPSQNDSM